MKYWKTNGTLQKYYWVWVGEAEYVRSYLGSLRGGSTRSLDFSPPPPPPPPRAPLPLRSLWALAKRSRTSSPTLVCGCVLRAGGGGGGGRGTRVHNYWYKMLGCHYLLLLIFMPNIIHTWAQATADIIFAWSLIRKACSSTDKSARDWGTVFWRNTRGIFRWQHNSTKWAPCAA